jgi:hypothetical protein
MCMQLIVLELWQSKPGEKLHCGYFCAMHCNQEISTFKANSQNTLRMHMLTLKGLHFLHSKLYRIWGY